MLRAIGVLLLALGLSIGSIFLATRAFNMALAMPSIAALDPALLESLFDFAVFGLLALVAWIALRVEKRKVALGRPLPGLGGIGLVLGIAGVGAALVLSGIAGVSHRGAGHAPVLLVILAGMVATLGQTAAEEYYFRGWLQPALQAAWGRWPGIAVTAIGFAAVHFFAAAKEPLAFLNLVLAGLWLGVLANRSGGLMLPIAAHFGWNGGEELLFGAAPNPGVGSFGALFDFDLIGNPLWGGSAEGLNASLSTVFVLGALLAACATWPVPLVRRGRKFAFG